MAFTDVFGGELLFPSQTSYISITTAVDVTLNWPREQQIGGSDVVADWMDINATAGSLNIDMPSASGVGTGNKATFSNIGVNAFTVRDSTGGTIQSVGPGEQWILILTDNTTAAGTWNTSQLGATVGVASASALAGAGLKVITTTLNQQIDSDVEASTPFTVVDGDRAKCLVYTAGAGTCNLPSPAGVGNDWFFMLRNSGSGTLNVLPPSGQIDGAASINMATNDSAYIFTDGGDFFTIGFGQGNTLAFDFVSIAIPGSGDFVLSGANLDRVSYRFTGLLTGDRKVVVPDTVQQYWVDNETTGAFTLTVGTAAQAVPPQVTPGQGVIFYCDATDIINAVSSTSVTFPILVNQGGTGAVTAGGARTNLGAAFDGQNMIAGAGMTGGGTLAADRTFNVIAAVSGGLLVNADDVLLDIDVLALEGTIDAAADQLAFDDATAGLTRKNTINLIMGAVSIGAFSDVTLTAPATGAVLYKSAGDWLDTPGILIDPAADVKLHQATIEVARTLTAAAGGFQANNTLTGAGFERVLTVADLSGATITLDDLTDVTLTAPATGAVLYKSAGDWLDTPGILIDPAADVKLHQATVEVARTLTAAAGGFEAENSLTGVGFRRVLTEGDALTDVLLSDTSIPSASFVTVLALQVEINRNYAITGFIMLDVPDAGDDSAWRWDVPTGATGEIQFNGVDQTGGVTFRTSEGGLFQSNDDGTVVPTSYALTGYLVIGGTAGDVIIEIAKLLDVGGDALVLTGSWIKCVPMQEAP